MKILSALSLSACLLVSGFAQSQKASPPATATQTLDNGATITISYSQPSLKGRTIGETVEPKKDVVWRMGANEATTFETDRDITVEGRTLPKGKYSVFGLWGDAGFTIIFNGATGIWGTQYAKNMDKDVLRVVVQPETSASSKELLTYTIDKSGRVEMQWGNFVVPFQLK